MGVDSRTLRRLVDDGSVERVARGLYRFTEAEPTEHYTLAAVCARVPDAIVCLLSALSVHGLGTQLPWQEWIAIPHKARAPRLPELPVRVVRFSGASLRYGVENAVFEGVPARITNRPVRSSTASAFAGWSARTWRSRRCATPWTGGSPRWTKSCEPRASAGRAQSSNPTSKRSCCDDM